MNKYILLFSVAFLIAMVFTGCSRDDKPEITKVNMDELNVPSGFRYETARTFSVNLSGSFLSPITIKDTDDNVLFRGLLKPEKGISTKITLPYLTNQLVLEYMGKAYTLPSTGSSLSYTFPDPITGR
ncbi:MAG: hypothetical protein PHI68_03490 [Candidatus Cloacimonetes bacterium]|nr:hypothetical protein [Candidatus Cloacimonadota bacterium]